MVLVNIVHIDIEISSWPNTFGFLNQGRGCQQQNRVAERHLGVGVTASRVLESLAGLAETESLREPGEGGAGVLIQRIRRDRHDGLLGQRLRQRRAPS